MTVFGEQVTRIRRVADGEDRYGNPVYIDDETVLDERGAFDPGGSLETVEVGRAPVVTTPKLYFLTAVDLDADDSVRVRGATFQVSGRPAVWVDPHGSDVGGTVVELEAVSG